MAAKDVPFCTVVTFARRSLSQLYCYHNFARFALFQGDTYAQCAADCAFEIKTPIKLARKFGASVYASAREFARTHHRACVVYVLEPIKYVQGNGAQAVVRRIEPSPSYLRRFGRPTETLITLFWAQSFPSGGK
jgi:hypothetical protein